MTATAARMPRFYCDYNASVPMRPGVRAAMTEALGVPGNPSSIHAEGRLARDRLEQARSRIREALGLGQSELVFTSGATEGLAFALHSARAAGARVLYSSALEHSALTDTGGAMGFRSAAIGVTPDGILDLATLEHALARHNPREGPPLVALQRANNETGIVQPAAEAMRITHAVGGMFLCDCAQIPGRLGPDPALEAADFRVFSGHKAGGPTGIGAVAFMGPARPVALLHGGGQERGARAGTENLPGAVGMGMAIAEAERTRAEEVRRLRDLRDGFEDMVRHFVPGAVFFGQRGPRLAQTSSFALPGLRSETLVIALDLDGFAVSAGAACSSGKVKPSRVLAAMGTDPALASGTIRASFGWASEPRDFEALATALGAIAARHSTVAAHHPIRAGA